MKIAYRIITPILALGAVAMGFFLKLFQFQLGGATKEIDKLVQLAQTMDVQTNYEYSAFEIIKLLLSGEKAPDSAAFTEIIGPIVPHVIAFIVFFVLALLIFLALGVVAAATNKRKAVIGLAASGLVLDFIAIVISRLAFDKIIGGEIALSDIVGQFSDNALMSILTTFVTIKVAALSYGFYAVFGMFILVIILTILTNMLINTPIQATKKHRRKKPLPKPSALIKKK